MRDPLFLHLLLFSPTISSLDRWRKIILSQRRFPRVRYKFFRDGIERKYPRNRTSCGRTEIERATSGMRKNRKREGGVVASERMQFFCLPKRKKRKNRERKRNFANKWRRFKRGFAAIIFSFSLNSGPKWFRR